MRRLLPGLLLLLTVALPAWSGAPSSAAAPASAVTVHPEWGSVSATNAVLHKGCRRYPYAYALTPPDGDWALETFLVGPRGKEYGSGYFVTGKDALAGNSAWRLCRRATRGGTYTIRARLTVQNGADYYDGWLPDTTFRLRKPRR